MKKLTLVALATLFALPAYANQTYIATELGGGSYDTSGAFTGDKVIDDLEEFGFLNIKVGQMLNENVRYYGYLQFGNSEVEERSGFDRLDLNLDTYQIGLGGDYLHHFTNRFYAIAGANVGYYNHKIEIDAFIPSSLVAVDTDISNSGVAAGANLGLGYTFTDQFGMEVGYRHTHFFGNEFERNGVTLLEIESSNTGYVNFNYKF